MSETDDLDDGRRIDEARRGDRAARGALLRELQDGWYRVCLSLTRDAETARDATQETALRFLRQLEGFRGDSRLRTWSTGIAINVCREMRRERGREGRIEDGADASEPEPMQAQQPSPVENAAMSESSLALHRTLDGLSGRQREAIVLRFFEELSVEETASAMGCATGTVKATVHQALRQLREKLRQNA